MKESVLRKLREKQGLSQRTLAEKSGISRGRLRRLEEHQFDQVTYGELKRISKTLGLELKEVLRANESLDQKCLVGRAGEASFQMDGRGVGYKIISTLPPRADLFIGKLFVSASKCLSSPHLPHADTIFLQTILGFLHIELEGEVYDIREGDHLLFCGKSDYTLKNPLVRDSIAFIFTVPSFTTYPMGGGNWD